MKNRDELAAYLSAVAAGLENAELTNLDFDKLRLALRESIPLLTGDEELRNELALLRDDYTARTTGMLKAIAAVSRRRSGISETLDVIDKLPSLSTADLIAAYRRASARFRDAFPTSFGRPTPSRSRRPLREVSVYK